MREHGGDFAKAEPVSDDVFRAYKAMYSYAQTPLNAKVEEVAQQTADWKEEKVTFDAAYGGERMTAYLFLPTNVRPPYQTVLFFPSARVLGLADSKTLGDVKFFDYIVQSGRAVMYPIYKGTYERQTTGAFPWTCPSTCNIARHARPRETHGGHWRSTRSASCTSSGAGPVPGEPLTGGAGSGNRAHQLVPLFEARRTGARCTGARRTREVRRRDGLIPRSRQGLRLEDLQPGCASQIGNLRHGVALPTSNLNRSMVRSYAGRVTRLVRARTCAGVTDSSRLCVNLRLRDFSRESCSAEGQIPALIQKWICALPANDTNGERYDFQVWHDPCT